MLSLRVGVLEAILRGSALIDRRYGHCCHCNLKQQMDQTFDITRDGCFHYALLMTDSGVNDSGRPSLL